MERGVVNPSKLDWLLKKHANWTVNGFQFQKSKAVGRIAWRVVAVKTPPLPPLPPSVEKTVTGWDAMI